MVFLPQRRSERQRLFRESPIRRKTADPRQNQVGGSIGGPIKKDKLFFYANYQETRQLNGAVNGIGYEAVILPPVPGGDRSAPGYAAPWARRCAQPITRLIRAPMRPTLELLAGISQQSLVTDPTSVPVAMNILNIKLPERSILHSDHHLGEYSCQARSPIPPLTRNTS